VSSELTINHSGDSRKRKMAIDRIDPEITTTKENHELLEIDMERDGDDGSVIFCLT
jgi:hypothetical protein